MCWYGNVGERIIETKLRLQRLNLIAMIGIRYYIAMILQLCYDPFLANCWTSPIVLLSRNPFVIL